MSLHLFRRSDLVQFGPAMDWEAGALHTITEPSPMPGGVVMHAARRQQPIAVGIAEGSFQTSVVSPGTGCFGH